MCAFTIVNWPFIYFVVLDLDQQSNSLANKYYQEMITTDMKIVDSQKCSFSKKRKTSFKEEISCKGDDGYSKGTHLREIHHEKKLSCIENVTFTFSDNNVKQAQHFPNIMKRLQQRLHEEWWRLLSFSKYPNIYKARCSLILLARQGFIYCGSEDSPDLIMCVFCSSSVKNLDENVDIQEMHRALNPNCPVVQGLETGNKPFEEYTEGKFDEIWAQLHHLGKAKPSRTPQCHDQRINSLAAPVSGIPSCSPSQNTMSNNTQQIPCNSNPLNVSNEEIQDPTKQQNGISQLVTNHASTLYFPCENRSSSEERPNGHVINSVNEGQTQNNTNFSESESETSPATHNAPTTDASSATATERQNVSSTSHCPPGNLMSSETLSQNRSSGNVESIQDHRSNSSSSAPSDNASVSSDPQAQPDCIPDQSQSVRDDDMQGHQTSYHKLGIITSRPKRPEYAIEVNRLESFEGWPAEHHIRPEVLARAGYFYTGYSDCARCFHCGGGLRNWEEGDNIWVEHARWFPKCAYMQQKMGQAFIDVVQHLSPKQEMLPFDDVMREMESRGLESNVPKAIEDHTLELRRDPAVRIIINDGFSEEKAVKAAQNVKERDQLLDAELIYEELLNQGETRQSDGTTYSGESPSVSQRSNKQRIQETLEDIKDKVSEMRQLSLCKICMDKEVSVVFLPCGHYVSCNDCSFALQSCPFCRENIKGVVRAILN